MFVKYVPRTSEVGVHVFGPVHGEIFLTYVVLALVAARVLRWTPGTTLLALVASVPRWPRCGSSDGPPAPAGCRVRRWFPQPDRRSSAGARYGPRHAGARSAHHRPRPARPYRTRAARGAGAQPRRRRGARRRPGVVARPRRRPRAAHRRAVPARLHQQDRDRRGGDAAARRGPAAPRRPPRPAPDRHAVRRPDRRAAPLPPGL